MLEDRYQRQFSYLRLSITDVCNFRCNYCLPDGYCGPAVKNAGSLSFEEIRTLVSAFAQCGINKLRLTGGEPSLRRDLIDIIAMCKSIPGIDTVALSSNGYSLHRNYRDLIDAGLDALNISIDSLRPETFRMITGHSGERRILDAVDAAIDAGLPKLKLNTVLMREHNAHQWLDFVDYVRDRPVKVRFIELMQTGDNGTFFSREHVDARAMESVLQTRGWTQQQRAANAGPAREYAHHDFRGGIGFITPYSKDFCRSCNRLRVSHDGKLHLCLFGELGFDLRQTLRAGCIDSTVNLIRDHLQLKSAAHELHRGRSGGTQHLAMIGG